MKTDNEECAQCGWPLKDHRNGFCYHYSDQDSDYFYNDRMFISKGSLIGKSYHRSFDGLIVIDPPKSSTPEKE